MKIYKCYGTKSSSSFQKLQALRRILYSSLDECASVGDGCPFIGDVCSSVGDERSLCCIAVQNLLQSFLFETEILYICEWENAETDIMREVNPKETSRAKAFELWMKAPNPMVTFFKTIDVTRLVRISQKKGYSMVIGTSAIIDTEIDGAVGMNSGIFNNPFMIWGRYRKRWFRYEFPISFQFHHTQMDGAHAGMFLARLQEVINQLYK